MLEKFLTLSENDFKALLREAPQSEWKVDNRREAFRYAKVSLQLNSVTYILLI